MQEPRPYRVSCREVAVRPGRAEHVQHTRDALPQAARDLLAEKGHAGTGTEEIAGHAAGRAACLGPGPGHRGPSSSAAGNGLAPIEVEVCTRRTPGESPAIAAQAGTRHAIAAEQNKLLVRRLVEEAVNHRNPDVLDEVADGEMARAARHWIGPFRDSFRGFRMEITDLIAEAEKMAAHLRCPGTRLGEWMGHPPTGRRFQVVDEIYIFPVTSGKLTGATAVRGQPGQDAPARHEELSRATATRASNRRWRVTASHPCPQRTLAASTVRAGCLSASLVTERRWAGSNAAIGFSACEVQPGLLHGSGGPPGSRPAIHPTG